MVSARRLCENDLGLVLKWRNHPNVRSFMITQHEISITEHLAWFERSQRENTRALLIVEEVDQPVGCVVFSNIGLGATANWSFYADPDSAPGTGRRMCSAALDFAFTKLKLNKVTGQVLDFNEASIRTHISLGFSREDLLREHQFMNGKFRDLLIFGLAAREWLNQKA